MNSPVCTGKAVTIFASEIPICEATRPDNDPIEIALFDVVFLIHVICIPLALVSCPCRSRTDKLGIMECADKFPVGYGIMLGLSAKHFLSIGMGKKATNFVPEANEDCIGCGKCAEKCPMEAITINRETKNRTWI